MTLFLVACTALAQTPAPSPSTPMVRAAAPNSARATHLPPTSVSPGRDGGRQPTGRDRQEVGGRTLPSRRMAFVFGVGRDAKDPLVVKIEAAATGWIEHGIAVTLRDWPIRTHRGVPPRRVNPPPDIARASSASNAGRGRRARNRDDPREFRGNLPMAGAGPHQQRFGNQRVYQRHAEIAAFGHGIAAQGTPVRAPADGVIAASSRPTSTSPAAPCCFRPRPASAAIFHLSRILDVKVGDVGETGRRHQPPWA